MHIDDRRHRVHRSKPPLSVEALSFEMEMPVGYLVTVLLVAWCAGWALVPRRAPGIVASWTFYFGFAINELPFLAIVWLFAATLLAFHEGDLRGPAGRAVLGIAIASTIALGILMWRSFRAIPVLRRALKGGIEKSRNSAVRGRVATPLHPRFRFRALLGPFFRRRWDVHRVANLSYGAAGARNLLDVYHARSRPPHAPVLIHFHGGAMIKGSKNREALPLLYRLASHGWVCISATYRLAPAAKFPDQLVDAKRVIAWIRTNGQAYGADTSMVLVAGGSAGAQLAAQAALTANYSGLQPGFEDADTSVAAAITLYGYYNWLQRGFFQQIIGFASVDKDKIGSLASPLNPNRECPPFLVVHGDQDTVLPVESARDFVEKLRSHSRNPIVYAELPGAQHTFDLFHSIRNEAVIDTIEAFAAWVRDK